jgi:hypothetical protein
MAPPVEPTPAKEPRKAYGRAALAKLVKEEKGTIKSIDRDGNEIEIPSIYFRAVYEGAPFTGSSRKDVVDKLVAFKAENKPGRTLGPVTAEDVALRVKRARMGLEALLKEAGVALASADDGELSRKAGVAYEDAIEALKRAAMHLPAPKWHAAKKEEKNPEPEGSKEA